MSGFSITVESNAPGLARAFANLAQKQLPFATAVALTRMAQDSVTAVRKDMPNRFRLHGSRLLRGIQFNRAEKRDWPNPKATVGSLDEFLVPQEFGGIKRPQRGASHVAIPTRVVTSRKTGTGRVPRSLLPRNVRKARKIPGDRIVAPLTAAKSATGQRIEEASFWLLRGKVQIKPRFRFRETVGDSAGSTYPQHFNRELEAAVRSARVRAGRFAGDQGRAA